MPRAGRYRHLLRLQNQTLTADGQGGYTKDWTDVTEFHGEVRVATGQELGHAGQLEWTNSFQVTSRFFKTYTTNPSQNPLVNPTPAQRLIWVDDSLNRILDVQAVINPDGRRRELVWTCTERVPGPGPIN